VKGFDAWAVRSQLWQLLDDMPPIYTLQAGIIVREEHRTYEGLGHEYNAPMSEAMVRVFLTHIATR